MKLLFQKLHPPLAALLLAALAGQGHAQNNLTNGLVAYYPFNGNANDESGGARHGVVNGATLGTNRFGLANSAYVFNGASFVDFPNAPQLGLPNTAFTVSLWVQAAGVGPIFGDYEGTATIGDEIFALHISLDNNPAHSALPNYLSIASRNFPTLGRDDTLYIGDSPLIGSGWHFVAYVMDGVGTCRVTVDGVLKATLPYNPALNYNQAPRLQAGRVLFAGQQQFFTGSMDDIRIYNRALATTEVAQLYAQDSDPLKVGLVAHYPFNGNVTDESGSGIIATVRNGENYVPSPIGIADRALRFSGSLNSVSLPDDTRLRNVRTVSAWFNCPAFPNLNGPIAFRGDARGGNDPFQFGIKPSGVIDFTINAGFAGITQGVLVSDNPVSLNAWHHVVATYTDAGGIMALYLDGVLLKTTAGVTAPVAELNAGSDPGWGIGNHPGLTQTIHNQQFTGLIDEVRFYNRPLSAAEVAQLHASEAVIPPVIASQPASVTANVGGSATFSATATGSAPLAYQWAKDGVKVPGATSATLTFANVQPVNIGNYTVVVTNAAGSVTSSVASLTIPGVPTGIWQNLVAYYPFNGNANDAASTNHGTVNGAALATDRNGVSGKAYHFDGVDDRITAAQPGFGFQAFSVNLWFKPDSQGHAGSKELVHLSSPSDRFDYTFNLSWGNESSDLSLLGIVRTRPLPQSQPRVATGALDLNGWKMATLVYGDGALRVYVDGQLAGTVSSASEPPVLFPGTKQLNIGFDGAMNWFDGSIDDVRLYNRALSAADVAQLHASEAVAPAIPTQPTAITASVGGSATLSVTATGSAPLAYQWLKNGLTVPGANAATLVFNTLQTNQAGSYTVAITNAAGSITSSVAVLTVNQLSQTITFGALPLKRVDDAPFTLTATASSGLPVSYSSSVPSVATVSGNTVTITGIGSTTITASQAGNATYLPAGNVGQTLVVSAPPSISTPPVGQSFTLGSGLTLSVNAGGTGPLFYQWQFHGTNLAGATGSTLTLTNLTAMNAGAYRVVIANAVGTVTSVPVGLHFFGDLKFMAATVLAGPVGQQYRVDYADVVNVGTTNWLVLTNLTLPSSPYLVIDPSSAGQARRFYRAVPLP